MEKLISVIVATYKRSEGLIPTLESIRLQEYKNKELIVTDDGSGKEIIEIIDNYLDKFKDDFINVTFVKNETNLGTVKNVQNAYKIAKGEIIKILSPGDLFYDKNVLSYINHYFSKYSPLIACGIPRTYHKHGDKVEDDFTYNYSTYFNLNNTKKTIFNMLYASRYIVGATLVFHQDIFAKHNLFLPDSVIYAEDLIQLYAVLKGIRIHLLNGYFIWYEHGSGISTNEDASCLNKLINDNMSFFRWLIDEKKVDKKTARKISIKIEILLKSRFPSKMLRYVKDFSFLEYKLQERIGSRTNYHDAILMKHKTFLDKQKDGFIELIKKGNA